MAEDVTTLRLLSDVGSLQPMDFAGRGIAWHAVAANRTETWRIFRTTLVPKYWSCVCFLLNMKHNYWKIRYVTTVCWTGRTGARSYDSHDPEILSKQT